MKPVKRIVALLLTLTLAACSIQPTTATSGQDELVLDTYAMWKVMQGAVEYTQRRDTQPMLTELLSVEQHRMPETSLPLRYRDRQGEHNWEEVAAFTGYSVETLRARNPGVELEEDGTFEIWTDLLLDPDYPIPHTVCRTVYVSPYLQEEQSWLVPDALDENAAIVLAEAWDYLNSHLWHGAGYVPGEAVEGQEGIYRMAPGARFFTYDVWETHMLNIFTPEAFARYGYPYLEGENGELWCRDIGAVGGPMDRVGWTYTEPQEQPDGDLLFGMIGLYCDMERIMNGVPVDKALANAYFSPVSLTPAEDGGWRVARLEENG